MTLCLSAATSKVEKEERTSGELYRRCSTCERLFIEFIALAVNWRQHLSNGYTYANE